MMDFNQTGATKIDLTDPLRCEVTAMKKPLRICLTVLLFLVAPISRMDAQDKESLHLVQTIPMPNVKGRIDHMDVDVKGKRLFVAGLENGSLEVVDLQAGKWSRSIPGFKKTQGVAYVPK
jgi:hypothetical protein